jgi:two-component system, OmpR family, response regulator
VERPADPARGLVLVVEDEKAISDLVRMYLTREGYGVHVESDGRAGLSAARTLHPVAIVLDVGLPSMDGTEVCRQLRGEGDWTPVIFVTARDDEVDRILGLELGADDYLTKPFSFVVLLARIRALLRRGVTPRPASLSVDDLVLDPAAHTVMRGEATIELTPREFSLLEFLMRRAGDAVSKADILHHVWDANHEGDANVVEVYVGYLRRKIDTPFGKQSVQTVRGAGYRLTAEIG